MNIQIWKGFKYSAYKYSDTCALILDDCCRFMSTKTVMDRMNEIYDEFEGQPNFHNQFQEACRQEFIGASLIANYGNKRTYIVFDIEFEPGPAEKRFTMRDG